MSSLAVAGLVACSDEKNDTFADGARGGSASGTAGTTQTGGTTGGSAMGGNAGDVSGAGGSGATAGSGASAGAAGSGNPGGAGSGGSGPGGATSGGSAGSGGAAGGTPVSCTITASSVMSSAIATVGIVTFSTDLAGLTSARIEFGPTTSYGMTAPVNFAQPNYRTLLIGMKPSRMYHYRVVARAGQNECTGPDATLMTGTLNNVPTITRMTNDAAALAGGFLVGSQPQGGTAFILDADGDVVWLYSGGGASRVHMSADSQHLWLLATNQGGGGPNVRRIGMDGMGTIEMHTEFGDAHHDFVVLPDDTVGFLQYYMGGRDRVMERAPDGTVRQIIDIPTAHGGTTNNHANSIQYFATDDSYTVSDLDQNCYVKFSRQGEVAWVLGGDTSEFTGPGATWTREHGHHLLAPNRLLFFNNGSMGSDAVIREVTLDLTAMTAANTWQYEGGESSQTLGDAQRLWNGNTLATYSNSSIIHEVSPSGELVESLRFTGGLGYTNKRQSLYGPPSRQTGQ